LSFTHEGYGNATSISHIKEKWSTYKPGVPDEYYVPQNITSAKGRRANAAIVMLGELDPPVL
jgi:alpha 1,2-mannosyltransferase